MKFYKVQSSVLAEKLKYTVSKREGWKRKDWVSWIAD